MLLLDVTPLSLGIETLGGVMTTLIDAQYDDSDPQEVGGLFDRRGQPDVGVEVKVFQGERPDGQRQHDLLGQVSSLAGILPAPRGVPQIEVTFDIDANGIVNVSAKDTGTGKEQSIRITASSGLSEADIQKLIKDAESHAEDDKKKQALIEVRNQADTLVYTTEKSLTDLGDKVDAVTRGEIESKVNHLKEALKGEDAEAIKRATAELSQASHKLAEKLYQQKAETGGQPGGQPGGPEAHAAGGPSGKAGGADEDVVDADYTEVK